MFTGSYRRVLMANESVMDMFCTAVIARSTSTEANNAPDGSSPLCRPVPKQVAMLFTKPSHPN
jgi:hypothetical protein